MRDRERYEALARELLVEGDLFKETDTVVIPVKTRGRTYGVLSQIAARQGAAFPDLPLQGAKWVQRPSKPDFLFVAFWSDEDDPHDPAAFEQNVVYCVESSVTCAAIADVKRLAFPLLGGRRGYEALPGMALGVELASDGLDITGLGEVPDIVFVTNKTIVSAA
jgi:predicted exporter